jgi:hypothetical protein
LVAQIRIFPFFFTKNGALILDFSFFFSRYNHKRGLDRKRAWSGFAVRPHATHPEGGTPCGTPLSTRGSSSTGSLPRPQHSWPDGSLRAHLPWFTDRFTQWPRGAQLATFDTAKAFGEAVKEMAGRSPLSSSSGSSSTGDRSG